MAATVQLIALKPHPYGKRKIFPGETFEASERDADTLVKLLVAKRADAGAHPELPIAKPTPPPRPTTPIAEVKPPEPTPLSTDEAEPMSTKTKRGTYRRRDLTAEGDE